ncbi:MAG: hypothetical protein F4Y99_13575 [Acidimicrobiaceae bacterium]|nr:hypothetical protein [Acidimicrobiaceae bacterium]MYF42905.1 hypothetical protein [Acidimicrobiaceae bacterium]MYJ34667.1 hypothetical protein [Acidimicrobiaceae bacterium]
MWLTPADAAKQYYDSNLRSAVALLMSIVKDRRSRGSGRPPGEPQAEWRAVLVLALAALEAGLVDVGLAAHHHRIRFRGGASTAATDEELARARGRLLTSLPLSAPNAQKVENFMLAQFGVLPSQIVVPPQAHFTTRVKAVALGGAGSGSPAEFAGEWQELAARLDAIQYFRNAIVHADSQKLETVPPSAQSLSDGAKGSIWALTKAGDWSLQMPHAVTAVRTTVAVFNTVSYTIYSAVGLSSSTSGGLKRPDEVVPFEDD